MPAREALLRLANEGYLVGTTRGFVTPRLGLDDIREIFEVRRCWSRARRRMRRAT